MGVCSVWCVPRPRPQCGAEDEARNYPTRGESDQQWRAASGTIPAVVGKVTPVRYDGGHQDTSGQEEKRAHFLDSRLKREVELYNPGTKSSSCARRFTRYEFAIALEQVVAGAASRITTTLRGSSPAPASHARFAIMSA